MFNYLSLAQQHMGMSRPHKEIKNKVVVQPIQ